MTKHKFGLFFDRFNSNLGPQVFFESFIFTSISAMLQTKIVTNLKQN